MSAASFLSISELSTISQSWSLQLWSTKSQKIASNDASARNFQVYQFVKLKKSKSGSHLNNFTNITYKHYSILSTKYEKTVTC